MNTIDTSGDVTPRPEKFPSEGLSVILPPDPESEDYMRQVFYLIPNMTAEVVGSYGGLYPMDMYITKKFLTPPFDHGVDLEQNTIETSTAAGFFSMGTLGRVKNADVIEDLHRIVRENPGKKIAYINTHGDTDPRTGKLTLESEYPLGITVNTVAFLLSEYSNDQYSAVVFSACNPDGLDIDMEDVHLDVFLPASDNTAKQFVLKHFTPESNK